MSHTTTIATVLITDINAFKSAVAELQRRGVLKGSLKENVKPRAYSTNQPGMTDKADFVLDLAEDGSPYDVAFYKREDGSLEARTDFYMGGVERVLGAAPGKDDDRQQARLGKLYQEYGAQVAERDMIQQGLNVVRHEQQDGSVQLEITA